MDPVGTGEFVMMMSANTSLCTVFYARPMQQCSGHQILNRMTKYASKMNFEQFCRHPEHHKRRFMKTGVPKHHSALVFSVVFGIEIIRILKVSPKFYSFSCIVL